MKPERGWAVSDDKLIQIAERGRIVHNTLAGGVRVEVKRV
jgi:hypothetical protein